MSPLANISNCTQQQIFFMPKSGGGNSKYNSPQTLKQVGKPWWLPM